jgi:transitional endoplasmic reticulum ATPase
MSNITAIEQYKVVFLLRKGAYYDVYRVVDAKDGKYFLKLINLAKLDKLQLNPATGKICEIEIKREMSHPNIMRQVDSGETIIDGQRYAYSVSDFIPGELLSENISRKGGCSIYDMKHIITGILNALKYLHSQKEPIIFNGISPNNIMLNLSAGSPISLLMDFDRARKLNKENLKCYMNGLSPFYLAPEMFKGLYSTRTDLYSVGALMYHMVYGMQPWEVDLKDVPVKDREQIILSARKRPLPIPDIKVFEMDEQLINVIAKSLMQDVDKRFQNADEFLKALGGESSIVCSNFEKIDMSPAKTKPSEATMQKKKGNGFADVAGMDELKKRLNEEVIDIIKNPEKYKRLRVKIPNGILLYGPPGCGKTYIAEKFAEEVGCNYMYVHCSDVASPYIHGGQEKIAALFDKAREDAPTVLFLDELDAMLADRSKHNNVSEYGEVNEFLTQLNNCADNHVFVIGATNNPKGIDSAALRSGRLDIKVYVPAPDESERIALFKLYLKDIVADDVDYELLAQKTDGYVSKDVCSLVNNAARETARADQEFISMQTLLDTIERYKNQFPSVSKDVLKQHERLREEFENHIDRKPVGFTQ